MKALPAGASSWVEIDLQALGHNLEAFRTRLAGRARLAAVVKANAYGHGVEVVAPAALAAGADLLAVVSLAEGLSLRRIVGPQVPIVVLGHVPAAGFPAAVEADLELTIYDPDAADALAAAARRVGRAARVHVKIETGTHRQGLAGEALIELARRIAGREELELAGLSTHFADIEDTTDHDFARRQLEAFLAGSREVRALVESAAALDHVACSAAAILFPETHLDMVRVGISLYGLWPSRETLVSARERHLEDFDLQPVLSWKARLAQVKTVPRGAWVGYGRSWRAGRESRIGVVPVGYYEGYDRSLSGRAHVLCHGCRAPVVGRVCMNMFMVDLTDAGSVQAGDEVVLIGASGAERISAEEVAGWAGTIHYEIVSRIHPALPRIPLALSPDRSA